MHTMSENELPRETCGQVEFQASIGMTEGDIGWYCYFYALEDDDVGHP